ncbi:related to monophenol monooxygenase (tyrosinase) [Cephalotrichum gorgonifer]|uniref:Related to monophenol monooxygenase (Tyrosinase) n=1 Tax=Cephalotrichum gorgonifer TaxID=2041049 RepID=A0AAE8MR11_9PEZI|nr:related to monophenol monooxygenase (tyrosinase) [Cephalotrichum gorgonifer]
MGSLRTLVLLASLLGAEAGNIKKRFSTLDVWRNGDFERDIVDQLADETFPKIAEWVEKTGSKCTLENAVQRKEWADLTIDERTDYISAVQCLMKLPPKAQTADVPGILNRYDDFVATHVLGIPVLHAPTNLFASHRYYIWAYEKALRDECGYKGYQPYMNYQRLQDPINSALFNGNETSMGGNGAAATYGGVFMPYPAPYNRIPAAGGGGCVTEGPFKDMVVSLGPFGTVLQGLPRNPQSNGLGSNPRCLRRDLNKYSAYGASANHSYSLVMDYPDVDAFYNRYLGSPFLRGDEYPWGLHSAGHYITGGDPGGDFYASPGDPTFWMHHASLDRLWWLWQMQEPETRLQAIPMVSTTRMTMEDAQKTVVDLKWSGEPRTLGELNDMMGSAPFCYIYV